MSWFLDRLRRGRRAMAVALAVTTAMAPTGVVWAAKGLVANGGAADTVTLFDTATGDTITVEYAFFKRPRGVAVTDDGRFAGVTNGAGQTITWLDLRDRTAPAVLGKTFVGANPKGIAIKGAVAIVTLDDPVAGGMDAVKVVAIGGLPHIPRDANITSLDLGSDADPEGVALTPDGRFAIVARAGLTKLAYVDLTGPVPALLPGGTKVGKGAFGVAVTPDGARALVTRRTGGTLSVVDLSGLPAVPGPSAVTAVAVGDSPGGVAVTHTYASAGKLTASVVATDNSGASSNPVTAGVEARANKLPTPAFRAKPSAGTAPLTVAFTDQSKDSDGQVVAVSWDFGDGATSTERNPTHLYAVPGKYVVTLTATDDSGGSASKTGKVEVRAP